MELFEGTRAPENAPACFAAPSIFSRDSHVCQGCPTFTQCADASVAALQELRKMIDVSDLMVRHSRAREVALGPSINKAAETPSNLKFLPSLKPPSSPITRKVREEKSAFAIDADIQTVIDGLNKNPATLVKRLAKAGVIGLVREELAAGRNPLQYDKWTWVSIACEKLTQGGFTKQSLVMAYMTKLGWKESTAQSHFVIITPAFKALGIIEETEGKCVVNPALRHDNV